MANYTINVLKISESGKSCFCKINTKAGPFISEVGVGYLYLQEGAQTPNVGDAFPYEGNIEFTNLVDTDTGEVRTTKSGIALQRIVLA